MTLATLFRDGGYAGTAAKALFGANSSEDVLSWLLSAEVRCLTRRFQRSAAWHLSGHWPGCPVEATGL